MRKRRANPEQQLQRAVIDHLKARAAPGVFYYAIPNGGYRRPVEAAIMKSTGTVAGVPDLALIHNGKPYFLELKAEGGRISVAQRNTLEALDKAGATCGIGVGLDDALDWLETHGLLLGRAA